MDRIVILRAGAAAWRRGLACADGRRCAAPDRFFTLSLRRIRAIVAATRAPGSCDGHELTALDGPLSPSSASLRFPTKELVRFRDGP